METWQLAVVILCAVLVGALLPALVALTAALRRVTDQAVRLAQAAEPTLQHAARIAERTERLSRGLEGGEKNVAALLAAMGELARSMERNAKVLNVASALAIALGPAAAAFVKTLSTQDGATAGDGAARDSAGKTEERARPVA